MEFIITDGVLTKAILEETDTHIVIPEGCREIADDVFQGNKQLVQVTLPPSVRKIGSFAFYNCQNLQQINLEHCQFLGILRSAVVNCAPSVSGLWNVYRKKPFHTVKN